LNYYNDHKCCSTATDKGLADLLGGHRYNILNNQDHQEVHLRSLRPDQHYIDVKGRHTKDFFGSRRRKFGHGESDRVAQSLQAPEDHPREKTHEQRRREIHLAQIENPQSLRNFQERSQALFPAPSVKRYSLDNHKNTHEAEKPKRRVMGKDEWQQQRGETMRLSSSAPSLDNPAQSLQKTLSEGRRKGGQQKNTGSSHMCMGSVVHTPGKEPTAARQHLSENRIQNYDFAVAKKNNHYSSKDKLTRTDPFFMRPKLNATNNSVKYDIITNERRWFTY